MLNLNKLKNTEAFMKGLNIFIDDWAKSLIENDIIPNDSEQNLEGKLIHFEYFGETQPDSPELPTSLVQFSELVQKWPHLRIGASHLEMFDSRETCNAKRMQVRENKYVHFWYINDVDTLSISEIDGGTFSFSVLDTATNERKEYTLSSLEDFLAGIALWSLSYLKPSARFVGKDMSEWEQLTQECELIWSVDYDDPEETCKKESVFWHPDGYILFESQDEYFDGDLAINGSAAFSNTEQQDHILKKDSWSENRFSVKPTPVSWFK
ncbi:hypothetical protein [Rubellicoccus peritrichatus]|uniref:Uncharacterized protein n=1 Tax=Rubellicoccus peritrichatus TaxID=3080537 RepID=A0AAQ3QU74_9BACT|nr:hypothetical protein [Puniceicoccus sp. CR14]WOO40173.1 hypothetical protein RZN69_16245 [Puniceicoccus sp. CR14]